MNNIQPKFWGKKDNVSLARSLRLAIVKNVQKQGMIDEDEAKEILSGPLSPNDSETIFDDSEWLTKKFEVT